MTTALFWAAIVQELEDHFLFKLEWCVSCHVTVMLLSCDLHSLGMLCSSCAEVLCEVVSVHKILLLKGVCTKVGEAVRCRMHLLQQKWLRTPGPALCMCPPSQAFRCCEGTTTFLTLSSSPPRISLVSFLSLLILPLRWEWGDRSEWCSDRVWVQ